MASLDRRRSLTTMTLFVSVAVVLHLLTGCGGRAARPTQQVGSTIERAVQAPATPIDSAADYLDRQVTVLEAIDAARVERMGEAIRVTFDNTVLFDLDSAQLSIPSRQRIEALARTLRQYPDTDLVISGHSDAEGDENYNQKLSERRALSVATLLTELGVDPTRLETIGFGALRPIASNESEDGRRQNQRIEIEIRVADSFQPRDPAGGE